MAGGEESGADAAGTEHQRRSGGPQAAPAGLLSGAVRLQRHPGRPGEHHGHAAEAARAGQPAHRVQDRGTRLPVRLSLCLPRLSLSLSPSLPLSLYSSFYISLFLSRPSATRGSRCRFRSGRASTRSTIRYGCGGLEC